jgi:hypothetical protein
MDNVQKVSYCAKEPSSQTCRPYLGCIFFILYVLTFRVAFKFTYGAYLDLSDFAEFQNC